MTFDYQIGDRVRVRTFAGAVVVRVVVDYTDEGPLFAAEKECEEAKKAGRAPEGTGWPAEYILGASEPPTST